MHASALLLNQILILNLWLTPSVSSSGGIEVLNCSQDSPGAHPGRLGWMVKPLPGSKKGEFPLPPPFIVSFLNFMFIYMYLQM